MCCFRNFFKRYGVIFICLIVCVVYIEVVYRFDIDLFLFVFICEVESILNSSFIIVFFDYFRDLEFFMLNYLLLFNVFRCFLKGIFVFLVEMVVNLIFV